MLYKSFWCPGIVLFCAGRVHWGFDVQPAALQLLLDVITQGGQVGH